MNSVQASRTRVIAGVLLALTFVAGGAAGVAADRWLSPQAAVRTRVVRDLSGVLDKLDLTPVQRSRAEALIERSGPSAEDAMRSAAERLRAVSDSVDAELRAILTPGQRARLDSLRKAPVFLLKRVTPGRTTVDTVRPGR